MKDVLINDRYRVVRKIADGGWSTVYMGIDVNSGEEVAVKLEEYGRADYPIIDSEASLYETFVGGPGIPRIRWYGEEGSFYVLITDLLGPSLLDLFEFCDRKFSLKTVLLLADQMISRIKYVHSKHHVHQDIKPENFLMGTGRLGNLVHIIDFGISRPYRDDETKKHRPYRENISPIGTMPFVSINTHLGILPSRRDDLESLGYVLIFLHCGFLPWLSPEGSMYAADATSEEINKITKEKKMNTPIEELCDGLPSEFATYLNYVRALEYEARPNYAYLRKIFSHLFARRRYSHDNIFDWALKNFSIIHPPTVAVDRQPKPDHSPPPPHPPPSPKQKTKKNKGKQGQKKGKKGPRGAEAAKAGKCLRSSVKGKERKNYRPKM